MQQLQSAQGQPLSFVSSKFGTLGVEVEVQLVDGRTLQPSPAASRLLARLGGESPQLKAELFQSMLELTTGICQNLDEVETDLRKAAQRLAAVADLEGVEVMSAGTHPFAAMDAHVLFPKTRYVEVLERTQWITRRCSVFGLHIHVGARNGDHAVAMINDLAPYMAALLALSASSPFLEGHDTGLASSRITAYEAHPASGTPPSYRSWSEFEQLSDKLFRAGAITSLKDLWWDIRPSPLYGTIELRMCDSQSTLTETLSLVALVQCLMVWLEAVREHPRPASTWRLRENKWRSARYGLEAELIVNEQGETRPVREIWWELLEELEPIALRLGCLRHLQPVRQTLEQGASYYRQRQVHQRSGSLQTVVQELIGEWREDLAAAP